MGIKQVFNVFYDTGSRSRNQEDDMVVQTPRMFIPYSTYTTVRNDRNTTELQFDCCGDAFVSRMEVVRDRVLSRVQNACGHLLKGKTHLDRIVEKPFGRVFRCNIPDISDIKIFDQHGRAIGLESVRSQRKVQLILRIRWFWVSQSYYGLDYHVLQVMVDVPTHLSGSLFRDEYEYMETYRKMVKFNIPMGAIEAKMKMDGIPKNDIDAFMNLHSRSQGANMALPSPSMPMPPPLPPPPPPPSHLHLSQKPTQMLPQPAFLNQIKSGDFKLKKATKVIETAMVVQGTRETVLSRMSKLLDLTRQVPRLQDILDTRSKLRKV